MRQINEELTGIEVSNLEDGFTDVNHVTDEQKSDIPAEQNSNSLDEQLNFREPLLDDKGNLEDLDLQGSIKRRLQQKEKDDDTGVSKNADDNKELSEYTTERIEHPDEDGDEKVYREHKNSNKDKNIALEPQADFQTVPSESQNLPSSEAKGWMENLEFILDIPLQIDIQLGQAKIPLREVLEISSGSLIKLNKSENSPVELLINGKLVAEGQIVVTEENTLGVQVTSIVNRVERIRSLR